jgi:hypothetical protein
MNKGQSKRVQRLRRELGRIAAERAEHVPPAQVRSSCPLE